MKKYLLFTIIVLLTAAILVSQTQIKKMTPQKAQILPSIKVLNPNGGEKIQQYKPYTIRWSSQGNIDNVRLVLLRNGKVVYIKDSKKNSGSYVWRPRKNIFPGKYKLQIMTLDRKVKDESDSLFDIIVPEIDLVCEMTCHATPTGGNRALFNISVMNNGTKILSNVMYNWVISTLPGKSMVKQDGAGYGTMYPGRWYRSRHKIKFERLHEKYFIEVFVDQDNRQREEEELRSNNRCSCEVERKR